MKVIARAEENPLPSNSPVSPAIALSTRRPTTTPMFLRKIDPTISTTMMLTKTATLRPIKTGESQDRSLGE
jgi:hypothetical protein